MVISKTPFAKTNARKTNSTQIPKISVSVINLTPQEYQLMFFAIRSILSPTFIKAKLIKEIPFTFPFPITPIHYCFLTDNLIIPTYPSPNPLNNTHKH